MYGVDASLSLALKPKASHLKRQHAAPESQKQDRQPYLRTFNANISLYTSCPKLKSAQICPCLPPQFLTAMASQSGMDVVAAQLGSWQPRWSRSGCKTGAQLAAQVTRIQERMDHFLGGNFTGPPQHLLATKSWVIEPPVEIGLLQFVNVQQWCRKRSKAELLQPWEHHLEPWARRLASPPVG